MKLRSWVRETGEECLRWVAGIERCPGSTIVERFSNSSKWRYDWGAAWIDREWVGLDRHLERLYILAKENRFQVTLVAFPVAFKVFADFVEDRPQRLLRERAERLEFGFLDLLPTLRGHRTSELFFDQCHPSPSGHRVVAEAIAGIL